MSGRELSARQVHALRLPNPRVAAAGAFAEEAALLALLAGRTVIHAPQQNVVPLDGHNEPNFAIMELNWPAVGLILGLAFLALFRVPLVRLLERTERVKDWLVAPKQPALPVAADQLLPTRDAAADQKAIEALTQGFNSQLLLLQEDSIREDLKKHGLSADSACEKVLLRHLAGTQITLHFEKTYATIYLSQLQALRWLNAQSAGVTASHLKPFFDAAVKTWPMLYVNRDFISWVGFLAAQGLMTESPDSVASPEEAEPFGLAITVLGREFLVYLVNGGRSDPSVG